MNPKFKPPPKPYYQPRFTPPPGYIRCTFALTNYDFYIIDTCAQENGLDRKGYSAALRLILRQWNRWVNRHSGQKREHTP